MKRSKRRIVIPILVIVFVLIIISCVLFLFYTLSGNYITISNKDDSANNATLAEAANSDVIIVNGIVVGATKGGKWISDEKFYQANSTKTNIEVDVLGMNSMYGTYKTASIRKYKNSVIYTSIAKEGIPDSYLAVANKGEPITFPGMTKLEATSQDEKYVKDAIGSYDLINGSVKILEVYGTNINNVADKIICATSKKANLLGAYSAVVYVHQNKPYLVKYSYVRDTKDSNRWPIYSLQFIMNLNNDSTPEIILQETTGDDISYSVLEIRNNNEFYEVLRTTVEI